MQKTTCIYSDNPDVYESLTGIQYINLVADIYRVDKETRRELTVKYATELELLGDLNSPISTYSHGMKQKLVLISAFVHSPKLMILDEPFVGLDPKASFTVKNLMKEFVENGGAIFFSTHVLEVAEKLCNKVAIIKDGKIIANGTMAEVKKDKSLESAFLESANA
jgi:ABC-2 type transport system ATP-binding protein